MSFDIIYPVQSHPISSHPIRVRIPPPEHPSPDSLSLALGFASVQWAISLQGDGEASGVMDGNSQCGAAWHLGGTGGSVLAEE